MKDTRGIVPRKIKGFRDIDPNLNQIKWKIINAASKIYKLYGFEHWDSPVLEYAENLGKYMPDSDTIEQGVYSFRNPEKEPVLKADAKKLRDEFGELQKIEDLFGLYSKKISSKIMKGLVHSGALDSLSSMRKPLIEDSENDYAIAEKLKFEVDFTGMYISDPMKKIEGHLSPYKIPNFSVIDCDSSEHVVAYPVGKPVSRVAKKSGKAFSIITLFYNEELIEVLCFKDNHDAVQSLDTNRPHVFEIDKTSEGSYFMKSVLKLSPLNLERKFFKKI